MTKSEQKPKLQIATRKPKAKGDMFANLRTREQIETVPFEELVTPINREDASHPAQPSPTRPGPRRSKAHRIWWCWCTVR